MENKCLTKDQVTFYNENGYLLGLPVIYTKERLKELNAGLNELMKLLKPGETSKDIREWHEESRFLYDICMNETILDCVEDLLGPNFFLWGSNFFIKEPHTKNTVGWHQDSYYWPLEPQDSVTAWIAFEDANEENGAFRVIPKSHNVGIIKHKRSSGTDSVLTLECETGQFAEDEAVSMNLKAGQFSLHTDKLIHGSPANHSDRRRVGLTVRYSSTIVKCDLSVNPYFKAYLCRGVDEYHHNPEGIIPTNKFGRIYHENISVEEAGKEAEKKLKRL